MRRLYAWLREAFDLNDLFVFSGLALVSIGAWMVYPPAAFIVAGAAVFWLGVR